jgi:Transglutaminase-like superfamily
MNETQSANSYDGDDVAQAALWLAAQDVAGLDVERHVQRLDDLGNQLRQELGSLRGQQALAIMAKFMAANVPLRVGPAFHLHEVMDSGCGLQMLCCGVWIAVANRAGLHAYGLDVPGWFLARIEGTVVDVAGGGVVLDEDEAEALVDRIVSDARTSGTALIQADTSIDDVQTILREPVTVSNYLIRLNRNLMTRYSQLAQRAVAREPFLVDEERLPPAREFEV